MKKLRLITKTLLVAAMLLGGGNCAWAAVTPFSESYSSTSITDGWSTSTGGRFTPVILNEGDNYYLSVKQDERNNNGATVTGTVVSGKAAAGDNFTITFDMRLSSSTNQSPTSFTIKDAAGSGVFFSLTATGTWATTWAVNGTSTQVTLPNSNKGNGSNTITDVTWCSYKITRNGEYTYLTITNKETSDVIFSQASVSGSSSTGGLGNMVFASSRYLANFAIDNIIVREVIAIDIPSTYTATFIDSNSGNDVTGGTTIYSDSERSSVIANGSLENGETYYYTSTQANYYAYQGSFTVNGVNPSISFTMTHHPSYTIKAVAGNTTISTFATGYAAKDATYSTYIPKAILYNDSYYVLDDANNANLDAFHASYTMGSTDEVKEIKYSLDNSIIYYTEYENDCSKVATYEYFAAQSSKGYSKILTGDNATMVTKMGLTSAGVFKVTVAGGNRDNSHTATFELKLKASDGTISDNIITQNMSGGQWIGEMNATVVIPAGSELYKLSASGNDRFAGDYIIVRKLYDVTDPSQIVGAIDFSTTANGVHSADYMLKQGETKVFTFQNHGTTYGNNWRIEVKQGETWKANVCADSYDYTANTATNITSYKESKDDGTTQIALDWNDYAADMDDARVVATLTYGTDGKLAIRTTSTGSANGYIYYVDHDVTGLSGDLTINLSVCKSWLEILSVENTAVSATIAASGYTTLSSAYGLDFTNVNGLYAYVVSNITKDAVTISRVEEMPANTGIVLKGTASTTYSIPVKADAAFSDTNMLQAAVNATLVDNGAAYILKSGEFCLLTGAATEADRTIPAGKAYLLATDVPNEARTLGFVFDDELTGINNVNVNNNVNGEFYDLQGRRVAAPQKGMYIMNGRKVIVK